LAAPPNLRDPSVDSCAMVARDSGCGPAGCAPSVSAALAGSRASLSVRRSAVRCGPSPEQAARAYGTAPRALAAISPAGRSVRQAPGRVLPSLRYPRRADTRPFTRVD